MFSHDLYQELGGGGGAGGLALKMIKKKIDCFEVIQLLHEVYVLAYYKSHGTLLPYCVLAAPIRMK